MRSFFQFLGFPRCRKTVDSDVRVALFAWPETNFVGTVASVVKNSISNPSRGREGIIILI